MTSSHTQPHSRWEFHYLSQRFPSQIDLLWMILSLLLNPREEEPYWAEGLAFPFPLYCSHDKVHPFAQWSGNISIFPQRLGEKNYRFLMEKLHILQGKTTIYTKNNL